MVLSFKRALSRRASGRERRAAAAVLIELRDELACQSRFWGRLADLEGRDSVRRTCMAVKAHAFAQAVVRADETLGRVLRHGR
ncbi:hypothetical protein SM436_35855 [Actinomadura chokoriensis]|uniref:Uncharacterized protein n=2 Tax=Actinomadura chokoriensis TaxID=454156 RepID=A0ABV4RA30_9ACTN